MKRGCQVWLCVSLLLAAVCATAQSQGLLKADYPGAAFATAGGNSTQGVFNASTIFTEGANRYQLSVYPVQNMNLPEERRTPTPGPASINSPNFAAQLQGQFANWIFHYDDNNNADLALSNQSLSVKTYSTYVQPNNGVNATAVGADLYLSYNPAATDPPKNNSLHWIQVLATNWGISGPAGTMDNKVDIGAGNTTPYYDLSFDADQNYFFDRPTRLPQDNQFGLGNYNFAANGPIYWNAEVLLVQETGLVRDNNNNVIGREVNIYDGARWGWQISSVPEPAYYQLTVLLVGGTLIVRRARRRSSRATVETP